MLSGLLGEAPRHQSRWTSADVMPHETVSSTDVDLREQLLQL
jgi:hypothetical protein